MAALVGMGGIADSIGCLVLKDALSYLLSYLKPPPHFLRALLESSDLCSSIEERPRWLSSKRWALKQQTSKSLWS